MPRQFNFKSQLNVGNVGESLFLSTYEFRKAKKADGREFDFTIDEGKTVELKTDTYSMAATPNFFMERYGNIETWVDGGPWRAAKDNVDYFVYLFIQEKTFFWFEPKPLCELLDKLTITIPPKTIDNKTWAALGYPVSRELCRGVCLIEEKF